MLSIVKCSFRISRKGLGSRMIGDTCMCDRSSWFYRFAIWCFVHSTFTDPGNAYIGYKGTTFETIIGKWSASLSTQEKKMTMYYYHSSSKRHVWLYNAKLISSNFSKKTEWACDWDECDYVVGIRLSVPRLHLWRGFRQGRMVLGPYNESAA